MKQFLLVTLLGAASLFPARSMTFEEWKKTLKIDETPISEPSQTPLSYAPVVDGITPSVVSIFTSKAVVRPARGTPKLTPEEEAYLKRLYGIDPGAQLPSQRGLGSGVILTADGYILTNNHVVGGADEIRVYIPTQRREFMAKIVGTDPKTDVALIKVEAENLPQATLTKSDNVRVGDVVLAVGTPFELDSTVTMGIVSAVGRSKVGVIQGGYENFIQTDASINPGNSGGALVDAKGRVIGINTAIASVTGANNGIGFAIPIDMAISIVHQLIDTGSVQRGFLGVIPEDITADIGRYNNLPNLRGALLVEVTPDSPAGAAGLQPGDVITHMNNNVIDDASKLRLLVSSVAPGTQVTFAVVRDGKTQDVAVTLESLNDGDLSAAPRRRAPAATPAAGNEILPGLTVEAGTGGLVVTDVTPNSPAANVGLRAGMIILDVNRKPVTSAAQARSSIKDASGPRNLLRVRDGEEIKFVVVEN